ncbi:NADPH-dependent FMN reductase [Pedobacter boryungensis]|uniref:NAD(P)H-dependent oxidoreductase n=1 Tax=Pedobacter boryungensis TaxID=869962 RepID=A0ABX2DG70_9SPHI|nr:NAD(P)H-dependent oxidoreductase [Pedobacter boryungensis]NQX33106.1 NAD(P)H-dependent oxidoreductase [Pedobacter boryungensis]
MITIISGTNRPASNTLKVAQYYQKQLAEKGLETELLDLQDLPENFIGQDLYGKRSEEFEKIHELVTKTTKFLFIIPEYNGSYPGVLKTFIDACAFPDSFYDKKACLVGISSGKYGNIRGIEHFNGVCAYLHLNVMPLRLHIPDIKTELDENAQFFKADTLKFTNQQMDKFIKY